ncbi:hypothetical protein C7B62_08345 [Pleurocapsa sp. CCALA 161]|uniref:hypothetical protein n=1 Tax=Pleurocapsa sp. CCALA 161 TaxID=2107688 RepID=UPI000D07D74D|nr:hypothetical protein [Pleurocapsa sp. CCALA 161]PSB10696.1 hypothetical protein C7B62_08345 [Pleurocapsa sp. CCALA 161]
MTNLHKDQQNNLVSFLRHNQPVPSNPRADLEQDLIDSLEPHPQHRRLSFKVIWTIPVTITLRVPVKLIATGFLVTSVSLGVKTPRTALEPKDLENFLVSNWYGTVDSDKYTANEKTEAYWLLPTASKSQPALSVLAH